MNAFPHHFNLEFKTGIRNKQLLMLNYLFPLGFYLMMGLIMTGINPLFRETIIPAMVTFAAMAAALLGIPDPLVNARERGIFRSYKINGVPSISILCIPAVSSMLHLLIVGAIITISAPLLFQAPLPLQWGSFLLVFLITTFAVTGLSVLIGVISANSRASVLWSQLIFVPSMLLGGLMLPYSMLPAVAQKAAQLLPATHAMNAFNGLAMGKTADFSAWGSLAVLFFTGALAFALALYLFRWDSRNSSPRRSMLLALLVLLPAVVGMLVL